jgi:biopolymer transport protein ExbD
MNADQTKVIVETDKDGDANNDNEVDDKDVEAVVRYIMNGDIKGFKGFNFKNADVNGDNKINAADIVEVMNIIKTNK